MTVGAGELMARKALRIERFAVDGEASGKKSLRLLFAKPVIAKHVGVLGDPKQFLGRELFPTVRASDSRQ